MTSCPQGTSGELDKDPEHGEEELRGGDAFVLQEGRCGQAGGSRQRARAPGGKPPANRVFSAQPTAGKPCPEVPDLCEAALARSRVHPPLAPGARAGCGPSHAAGGSGEKALRPELSSRQGSREKQAGRVQMRAACLEPGSLSPQNGLEARTLPWSARLLPLAGREGGLWGIAGQPLLRGPRGGWGGAPGAEPGPAVSAALWDPRASEAGSSVGACVLSRAVFDCVNIFLRSEQRACIHGLGLT